MGGRFCSFDQTHSECENTSVEVMSFRPRNRVKSKKKRVSRKLKSLCPRNQVKTKKKKKKRSSPQFGTKFGRNLWDLFGMTGPVSPDQPALKSRWGTLNLDGGMLTIDGGRIPPRPPTI